ncbi:unnamed protein product [Vitrella brassicaformis CCMP3155]|uniref:Uncharacterized protein n=2 Tax=Vitrella brassicaformis TaxID=1169539 RepID=A0A0G4EEF2_VITBC|nr:unnamed protein product [Vitrella brassicaformis CCMP3155]|eukprot:CEL93768.1 unnamed protein product [Vitrella brassicaformis CCMP3155]
MPPVPPPVPPEGSNDDRMHPPEPPSPHYGPGWYSPPLSPAPSLCGGTDVLTIFDWDDTLFPTNIVKALRVEQRRALYYKGGKWTSDLLLAAAAIGEVAVISNGNPSWLEEAVGLKGYEEVRRVLQQHTIPVISARQHAHINGRGKTSSTGWKMSCVADLLAVYKGKGLRFGRVVTIGDSTVDMAALEASRGVLPGASLVKVLLVEKPSESTLMLEHDRLIKSMPTLVETRCENFEMELVKAHREQAYFSDAVLTSFPGPEGHNSYIDVEEDVSTVEPSEDPMCILKCMAEVGLTQQQQVASGQQQAASGQQQHLSTA